MCCNAFSIKIVLFLCSFFYYDYIFWNWKLQKNREWKVRWHSCIKHCTVISQMHIFEFRISKISKETRINYLNKEGIAERSWWQQQTTLWERTWYGKRWCLEEEKRRAQVWWVQASRQNQGSWVMTLELEVSLQEPSTCLKTHTDVLEI